MESKETKQYTGERESEEKVKQILSDWPEVQKEAALKTIEKYGYPQEATSTMLKWFNNGKWKRTEIYRETYQHNWPVTHPDFLANTIDYKVPINKMEEVQLYDGSSYPHRTKGELTVMCDKEEHNIMSFNMVHEIVNGKRSVKDAKRFYTETFEKYYRDGTPSMYMEKLIFDPQMATGDPDESMTMVKPPYLQ